MAINPDYKFERLILKAIEKKEVKIEKEKSGEKKQKKKVPAKKKINILPQDAHQVALKLIQNAGFKKKLKEYIGEIIVQGENITRIDFIMDKNNDSRLLEVYGLTKEHFKDISNGNLTSFDLAPDGQDLAIYFKRATGEPAIRPIDTNKLAIMLSLILNVLPEYIPQDLQSDLNIK